MAREKLQDIIRDKDRTGSPWHMLLPLPVILAGLASYLSSFAGAFLFDDRLHILGHRRLKFLWPLGETLSRRRPVVDYSLAVNYSIGREEAWGYHAFNVAIHTLAALVLFGIVRRTLLHPDLRKRFGAAAPWLALTVALMWVVHPLQTQSVTYLIQRAESMMGLFYLLTLYCVIRGADSPRRTAWYTGAVIACTLGMGSKAVMVTAPAMVLLYDWCFLSKSWVKALRRRWGLYAGLAATWGVLWACGVVGGVLSSSTGRAHVGFGVKGISPFEYASTQFGVLVQYLKLSLWPYPLCLDYGWPVARTVGAIMPPVIVIGALLAVTVWALIRRPACGFIGAWFFLILAPTSSFIPIKDPLFEHRMYLSLAAVIVLAVLGSHGVLLHMWERAEPRASARADPRMPRTARIPRWWRLVAYRDLVSLSYRTIAAAAVAVVVTSLAFGTIRRNREYHSEAGVWQDVRTKRPGNARAAENLGTALLAEGRIAEAMTALRDAVRISPRSAEARNGLGFALVAQGYLAEATESFLEAIRLRPSFARAQFNLGKAYFDTKQIDRAIEQFRTAIRISPGYSDARLNLGNALMTEGEFDEALAQYGWIVRIDPQHDKAWGNLGIALLNVGRIDEAIEVLQRAVQMNENPERVHNSLGIAFAGLRKWDEALEAFRQALLIKYDFAEAHGNMARCLTETGNTDGAVRHYKIAVQIQPQNSSNHYELGLLLDRQGNLEEAIEEFEKTLRIQPGHAGAGKALEIARSK